MSELAYAPGSEDDFIPDRYNPDWGINVAPTRVPQYPDALVLAVKRPFMSFPIGFRAYTKRDRRVYAGATFGARTHDEARWRVLRQCEEVEGITRTSWCAAE